MIEKQWLTRLFIFPIITIALVFFFAQYMRLAPNTVDGALILGYLEEISRGGLPYWNFIDVYGPLNWVFPYLFYELADQEVWGVRVWIVVLKILSAAATYRLIQRLSNTYYAVLGTFVAVVLLGQPWQLMQTPYASHTAYPIVLMVWCLVLCAPFKRYRLNIYLSSVLTAIVLWIKLNTGMFLFAAALFYYFYWASPEESQKQEQTQKSKTGRLNRVFWILQYLGLFGYAAVFYAYIHQYFGLMYFLYLALPLLILIVWTGIEVRNRQRTARDFLFQLKSWLLFLICTVIGWACFFLGYYGWQGGVSYLSELFAILTSISYEYPFLPPGAKSYYEEFSEYYWLQLPWLLTFLFCLWIFLQKKTDGRGSDPTLDKSTRNRTSGLFVFFSLHAFVLYPRSDEAHMFQAVLPSVAVIFVLFYQIEKLSSFRVTKVYRYILAIAVGFSCSTVFPQVGFEVFTDDQSDFYGDRMRYLKFRPKNPEGVGNTSKAISDHDWDIATNRTAICVDKLTEDNTEILVLTTNQLVNYISKTRPYGGGYRYLLYLLKNRLLDRKGIIALLPEKILFRMVKDPPRVIVSAYGKAPLLDDFPELNDLMDKKYEVVQAYEHILIYLPKEEEVPKNICGRTPEKFLGLMDTKKINYMLRKNWFRD